MVFNIIEHFYSLLLYKMTLLRSAEFPTLLKLRHVSCLLFFFVYLKENLNDFPAGLDGAQRLLVAANSQAALQTMMNQQNAAAMRGAAPLGGAPLILSPRLQVPTSLASGLLNGSTQAGPPPLIGEIPSACELTRRST